MYQNYLYLIIYLNQKSNKNYIQDNLIMNIPLLISFILI